MIGMARSALCFAGILLMFGCDGIQGNSFYPKVPDYPSSPQRRIFLKKPLREISGIFYHGPNELIAINDEEGALFFINAATGEFQKKIFGAKGDYEDLVETPGGFYILESNGTIHHLDLQGKELGIYPKKFHKSVEFESLCYDPQNQALLMICKSCGSHEPFIHAWKFDLQTNTYSDMPGFSISLAELKILGKDAALVFKPSAAAYSPISGKLFLLASVGKILVQCDHSGKPEAIYSLNPDQFPQPEGLCFTPSGDLYISNEGGEHKASLLYYPIESKSKP